MLTEAVAPLLESLHTSADVAVPLASRFNMQKWFQAQGLAPPVHGLPMQRKASMPQMALHAPAAQLRAPAAAAKAQPDADCAGASPRHGSAASSAAGALLCFDFDLTLTDWDAGERLCDELAPELTSLLTSLQMPANFVPVTNTVLAEMSRRGVTRDRLVACLHEMGREVPAASVRMLQVRPPSSAPAGLRARVLSACLPAYVCLICMCYYSATWLPCIHACLDCLDCVRVVWLVQAGGGGGGVAAPWPHALLILPCPALPPPGCCSGLPAAA